MSKIQKFEIIGVRNLKKFFKDNEDKNLTIDSVEAYSNYKPYNKEDYTSVSAYTLSKSTGSCKASSSLQSLKQLSLEEALQFRKNEIEVEGNYAKSWTWIFYITIKEKNKMDKNKLEEVLNQNTNNYQINEDGEVTLTFDCGDNDDTGRFTSKLQTIADDCNIEVAISESPSYESEEDEINDINCWNVVDVQFTVNVTEDVLVDFLNRVNGI